MIDIRKLKELVKLMVENDLSELDLRDEQETVVVKRGMDGQPQVLAPAAGYAPSASAVGAAAAGGASGGGGAAAAEADPDEGLHAIVSPMVGTFYAAADPESPPFIKKGDEITPDSVVCIVEAMKVFSEIKAECAGTVEKVLVNNGDSVEYGQKLFLVKAR